MLRHEERQATTLGFGPPARCKMSGDAPDLV
jgi:hypothetical protein